MRSKWSKKIKSKTHFEAITTHPFCISAARLSIFTVMNFWEEFESNAKIVRSSKNGDFPGKLVHVVGRGNRRFVTMNWTMKLFSYSDTIYLKRSGFLVV